MEESINQGKKLKQNKDENKACSAKKSDAAIISGY